MVEGRVNFPSKGSMKGNMAETLWGHSWCSQFLLFFNYYFFRSAAYFFEIIMLISLKGTLTQTRTKLDRVTFPCEGPMRSRYVVIMVKFQIFIGIIFN